MDKEAKEIRKIIAVNQEVEASYQFIAAGLGHLYNQNSMVSNNHVFLQLMAAGIERLLKILLLLKDKHLNGSFPDLEHARNRFQQYNAGHGIAKMLNELLDYSDSVPVMQVHPMLTEGISFLKNDAKFNEFIGIITEFAISQRYHYIDTIILEKENPKPNPFELTKTLICSFSKDIDVSQMSFETEERIAIEKTIICIETGVVALSRFFTHGLGEEANRYSGDFSKFILLKEDEMGKLLYNKKSRSPRDFYEPMSVVSLRFLLLIASSKSKVIHHYQREEWPFHVDKVTVYYKGPRSFLVRIGNQVFALTSKTATRFKIPVYRMSKNLKPRQVAQFLLEDAERLVSAQR